MFLQEFIRLLYRHFIVAIIKVIWENMGDIMGIWDIITIMILTIRIAS